MAFGAAGQEIIQGIGLDRQLSVRVHPDQGCQGFLGEGFRRAMVVQGHGGAGEGVRQHGGEIKDAGFRRDLRRNVAVKVRQLQGHGGRLAGGDGHGGGAGVQGVQNGVLVQNAAGHLRADLEGCAVKIGVGALRLGPDFLA